MIADVPDGATDVGVATTATLGTCSTVAFPLAPPLASVAVTVAVAYNVVDAV